jgi:protein gp37
VTGCAKISRGCDNCYAERFSERFRGVVGHPFSNGFDLTLRPERLKQPLAWKRPRTIFVNSMSDLFHKEVPRTFVDQVFDVMERADWHIFQVLTKRSSLLCRYLKARYGAGRAPAHIWCGVSIEDAQAKSRLAHLRASQATTRFLSPNVFAANARSSVSDGRLRRAIRLCRSKTTTTRKSITATSVMSSTSIPRRPNS